MLTLTQWLSEWLSSLLERLVTLKSMIRHIPWVPIAVQKESPVLLTAMVFLSGFESCFILGEYHPKMFLNANLEIGSRQNLIKLVLVSTCDVSCPWRLFQCGENTGSMAAMLRGKLSKSEESYRKCSISAKLYFFRLITFLMFPQTVLIFFIAFLTFSDFPHFFLKSS